MEDVCLMNFNFNLFLAPTAGGLQWDQFLECGKSGLRQHKRIAWDATPSWHHQDHHFVPRTAAAGIGSGFSAENWSWRLLRQLYNNASNHVYILHTLHIILTYTWTFGITGAWFRNIDVSSRKRIRRFFLPTLRENLVCSFSPARSRNWLSPWQQRWWTLAHLRGGNDKKWWQFTVHLLYFFLRKTVMLKYGCY